MLQLLEKYIYDLELSLAYRLRSFRDRYCSDGDISYLYFAAHAAFPIVITPDLLYKIWLNFRKDQSEKPKDLQIPFIAVSDLLLSQLFRVTGRNTFEMPGGIRTLLLRLLQEDDGFGEARIDDLALFLKAYLQENAQAIPYEAFRQALEYIVMARFQPEAAAEKLINAFNEAKSAGEVQHLLNLAEAEIKAQKFETSGVKHPLVVATQLVRGIQEYRNGNIENGINLLKSIANNLSDKSNGFAYISIDQNIIDILKQDTSYADDRPLFFGVFVPYISDKISTIALKREKFKILESFNPVLSVGTLINYDITWERLKAEVIQHKDKIIIFHFAGQCTNGNLVFGDQLVNAIQLVELLKGLPNLKLVFLNAVISIDFINVLAAKGIKCIISGKREVAEHETQDFVIWFYSNLVGYREIKKAFDSAKNGWETWILRRLNSQSFQNGNILAKSKNLPWRLNSQVESPFDEFLKKVPNPKDNLNYELIAWNKILNAYENGKSIYGKVKNKESKGFVVDFEGSSIFVPTDQLGSKKYRKKLNLGLIIGLKITNVDINNKRAEGSHITFLRSRINELVKGQILEGTIKNIVDFGAFVSLDTNLDGLLHITDISWGRISHPREVLTLNQKISVVVLDFDENEKRIYLGLKQLQPHPWEVLDNNITENSIVKGKIVNIEDYGGFLEIQPGVEGLIHVSEVSWSNQPINAREFFKLGQEYSAKVVTVDRDERKMSLSLKQLAKDPWSEVENRYLLNSHHTGEVKNLTPYGVFIELEKGIGGMVHISDLSWTKRFSHPSEFTKVGEKLDVTILNIDKDNRKLSLGHKQLKENPWGTLENVFPVGSYHEATILRFDKRGANVQLPYGLEAFAPIKHIYKEDNTLAKVDEVLTVKVIEFNRDDKRILVSHLRYLEDIRGKTNEKGNKEEDTRKITREKLQDNIERTSLGSLEGLLQLNEQLKQSSKEDEKPEEYSENAQINNEQNEARIVLKALVNANGDVESVRPLIIEYLQKNSMQQEARFVVKAWLEGSSDIDTIRPFVIQFLQNNSLLDGVGTLLELWLQTSIGDADLKNKTIDFLKSNIEYFKHKNIDSTDEV